MSSLCCDLPLASLCMQEICFLADLGAVVAVHEASNQGAKSCSDPSEQPLRREDASVAY